MFPFGFFPASFFAPSYWPGYYAATSTGYALTHRHELNGPDSAHHPLNG